MKLIKNVAKFQQYLGANGINPAQPTAQAVVITYPTNNVAILWLAFLNGWQPLSELPLLEGATAPTAEEEYQDALNFVISIFKDELVDMLAQAKIQLETERAKVSLQQIIDGTKAQIQTDLTVAAQ